MKLYNNFSFRGLFLAGLLCLSGSCTDFLTRDNETGTTDDNFWHTQQECENALGSCKLWVKGAWGGDEIGMVFQDGATDNAYFSGNFDVRIQQLGNGSLLPPADGNAPGSWEYQFNTWNHCYIRIRRCNRFLENVDKAFFTVEEERARMKAEARVWRAWYHIRLLKWYGRNDGIPYLEKSLSPTEIYMSRTPVDECLKNINRELDEVIESGALPFVWDDENMRANRMSLATAYTLKMDVNFQFKQYEEAKKAAKALIDSDKFELYKSTSGDNEPGKNYRDLFNYTGKQNKERILWKSGGSDNLFFRCMSSQFSGQGVMSILKSLVDSYELADGCTLADLPADERERLEKNPIAEPRDPRFHMSIFTPGENTGFADRIFDPFNPDDGSYFGKIEGIQSGYMMKKFMTSNDFGNNGNGNLDFVIYRYAEVLLDYVECLVETGKWDDPDVEKYINMIRNRAGMENMDKSVYNSEEKVRELYRRERRVEFAFENKRYDDIRRWGIGNQVMQGAIYGAWNPDTQSYIKIEERRCLFPKFDSWPLSQNEVTSNPNISQPTGW